MLNRPLFFLTFLGLAVILGSCSSSTTTPATPTLTTYYTQTNLVSDTAVFGAAHIDPNLVNAWGIAFSTAAGAHPWISANGSFTSAIYDTTGGSPSSVTIPAPGGMPGGAPSGIVFNSSAVSTDFGGNHFIFCTEDGTLAGSKPGAAAATIVSDSSASGAVYKGLAIVASASQLYATDFHNNTINVFDKNFNVVNHFGDATVPAGYGPFGITNINDTLYVTYARQKIRAHDDSAGASIGFVDRFTPGGMMIGRFVSGGNLNSPWGIALAPASFGQFANAILIGNFGDGRITGYDHSGNVIGQLASGSRSTISIQGLWGISFNPSTGSDPNKLFFTAGPYEESHGLFGYLHP